MQICFLSEKQEMMGQTEIFNLEQMAVVKSKNVVIIKNQQYFDKTYSNSKEQSILRLDVQR